MPNYKEKVYSYYIDTNALKYYTIKETNFIIIDGTVLSFEKETKVFLVHWHGIVVSWLCAA